jgi:hypothetical protein
LRQHFVRPGVLLRTAVTHQERLFLQYVVHSYRAQNIQLSNSSA